MADNRATGKLYPTPLPELDLNVNWEKRPEPDVCPKETRFLEIKENQGLNLGAYLGITGLDNGVREEGCLGWGLRREFANLL